MSLKTYVEVLTSDIRMGPNLEIVVTDVISEDEVTLESNDWWGRRDMTMEAGVRAAPPAWETRALWYGEGGSLEPTTACGPADVVISDFRPREQQV